MAGTREQNDVVGQYHDVFQLRFWDDLQPGDLAGNLPGGIVSQAGDEIHDLVQPPIVTLGFVPCQVIYVPRKFE